MIRSSYPLLQDLAEVDAWGLLGAHKDDFLLYDSSGNLVTYFPKNGGPNTDLSTPDGLATLKAAVMALE